MLTEFNLVEFPGHMFEDNAGAMILSRNRQTSKRTKHADLKHHCIREFVEDRDAHEQGEMFKIESKFNTSDIGDKILIYELSSVTQMNLIKVCHC